MGERSVPRVLLKLSGELLSGGVGFGIDQAALSRVCEDVTSVLRQGVQLCIVVGGGNFFRGGSGASVQISRSNADRIGMLATIMNAIALQDTFRSKGISSVAMSSVLIPGLCRSFLQDEALEVLETGGVPIFAGGTGQPFFTTDTAAVLRAVEMGCDRLFKGTHVDGVYSDDPAVNPDAVRYERLTCDQVLAQGLKVMDSTAIAMARDQSMPIVVFSLVEEAAFSRAFRGEIPTTEVVP